MGSAPFFDPCKQVRFQRQLIPTKKDSRGLARSRTTMPAFTHHIFVCCNQRSPGHRRGCCDPEGNAALRNAFKAEVKRRNLQPLVRANKAGCLDQCEHGPNVVIYPQGIFYGGVTLDDVTRIIEETVIGGRILADLQVADSCLNTSNCQHIQARRSARGEDSSD